jgi:hypothetical protein
MHTWNQQQIVQSYYSWASDLEMTPFLTARSLPIPTALQSPELPFSSTNLLREGEKKTADSVCVRYTNEREENLRARRKLGCEASES